MLSIRLKPSLERRLSRLAKQTGRTKTFYATKLIEENIEGGPPRETQQALHCGSGPEAAWFGHSAELVVMLAQEELVRHACDVVADNDVARGHLRKFLIRGGHGAGRAQVIPE